MRKIFLAALAMTALSGCGEEKPEKETWYWIDDCWQEYIPYRSWKEGGTWKYEIEANINTDILLTYTVDVEGKGSEEKSVAIKSGKTTGAIDTEVPESEILTLGVISVISLKGGLPDRPIECELKNY